MRILTRFNSSILTGKLALDIPESLGVYNVRDSILIFGAGTKRLTKSGREKSMASPRYGITTTNSKKKEMKTSPDMAGERVACLLVGSEPTATTCGM